MKKKSKMHRIKRLIRIMRAKFYPIVAKYISPYTRREIISLLDLIIFSVLCMVYFSGVYKRGYEFLIEDLGLFPKIRYNKIVERINRYEQLLIEIQKAFIERNSRLFIDTMPIKTKELVRRNRHEKRGFSVLIKKMVVLDTILRKNVITLDIRQLTLPMVGF